MKLNMRQSDTGMAVQQTAKHPFLRALASLFRVRTVHYQPFPAHEPQPYAEPLASAPFMAPRKAQIIPFPTPAGTLPTRKPPMPVPPARSWIPREPITFPASQR